MQRVHEKSQGIDLAVNEARIHDWILSCLKRWR